MTGRSIVLLGRDARMAELAAQGKTASEIANAESIHVASVYLWARNAGVKLARNTKAANAALQVRAEKMVNMYRQGVTMAKIGAQFSVTREYVRQIIAAQGVTSKEGGQAVVAVAKADAKKQSREAKSLALYGLPLAVMQQLRKDKVLGAYRRQECNASIRGIEWRLTFAQWFACWQVSGKLHLRGVGKGKYVMSRVSDAGCYELGNVHIQLATENSREAVEKWRGKEKANKGVFCLYPGREMAWWAKVGKQSLGFFKTEAEAAEARAAYLLGNPQAAQAVHGRGYAHRKSTSGGADRYQVMVSRTYVGSYATPEQALAARAAFIAQRNVLANKTTEVA